MIKKANKGKRFAAIACAAVVGISGFGMGSTSVQAAEVGTTISETGAMNYVDMSQYTQVLLPTSGTMAFALDPQGLSTMTGNSADAKDLEAAAGNIVSNGEVSVANYGYYPIKVRANFYVTDSGTSTFVDNEASVESDTSKRIYLTITPSSAKTTVTEDGTGVTGTEGYAAASEGIAVTGKTAETAQGMVYALAGAEYEFTKTTGDDGKDVYAAQRKVSGEYGAAAFKIGGKINKNADWAAYTGTTPKTLKLKAVFSFTTMTNDEYAYLTNADTGFIKDGTYNQIKDTAPEISVTDLKMDSNNGATMPLSLGTGATATTVSKVQLVKHTTKTKISDGTDVPVEDEKITVKGVTTNATGTAINIPTVDDMKTVLGKVDKSNPAYFDEPSATYLKLAYEGATYRSEFTYGLIVTLADGTVTDEIPVTIIETISPTITYTGAALPKVTTATQPEVALTSFTVDFGNGGATEITKIEFNTSKTTATISAMDPTKLTVNNGNEVYLKASSFKYVSGSEITYVVFTATFDTGETTDFEVPVAKK